MNTFRISALAIAIVLALNSFASAQCNAGRQIDNTNLNLGLQAAPVAPQLACANGQCGAASVSAFAAPQQNFAYVPQTSVMVNTPRVAVSVGAARYQPLYVVTTPQAVVMQQAVVPQFYMASTGGPAASASASAGVAAASASSATAFDAGTQVLAFDPSVNVSAANVCASGNCGGRTRLLGRIVRPRRNVSVARSRSVTVN